MVHKKELLAFLNASLQMEEKGLPVYVQHLDDAAFLSGFTPEDRTRVVDVLKTLQKESLEHKDIFTSYIKRVMGADRDVY